MSRSTLNLALLGCGTIARRHGRTLARFGAEVRCFYASRDPARAAEYSAGLGGAGSFGSYATALADERIDAVLITTPPDSHLDLTLCALAHDKDVIVEKPALLRSQDFTVVRAAEAASDRRVLVAENYCYKPLARVLRGIVASGALGEIRFVHLDAVKYQAPAGWRADPGAAAGGALFEGGVHWIDLLANLGLRIEAVHGFRPGDWQGRERSMLVVAEYEEGAVGTLAHSWEVPSPLRGLRISRISGTRGSAAFESNGLFVRVSGARPRLLFPGFRDIAGYRAMFRDFLTALRTGSEPLMSLHRAQRGLELIEAAYRSVPSAPELETVS
ncbi:MAG: Gfo/Idh/MocA family oxidoreductase [Gemmatimonadales bacterium]